MSAVGADSDGAEIRRILSTKNLPDGHVQTDGEHPTGRVNVTLHDGKPSYEILGDVAWDFIPFDEVLRRLAGRVDAVCFGSLAQRNAASRKAIHSFLASMCSDSLRVFDINLISSCGRNSSAVKSSSIPSGTQIS
jgi:fructokinase